jgi:hypothetical protein
LSSEEEYPIRFDNTVASWLEYSEFTNARRALKKECKTDEFKGHFEIRKERNSRNKKVKVYFLTVEGLERFGMKAGTEGGVKVRDFFIEVKNELSKVASAPRPSVIQGQDMVAIEQEKTEQKRVELKISKQETRRVIIKEQRATGRVYKQHETKAYQADKTFSASKFESEQETLRQAAAAKASAEAKVKVAEIAAKSAVDVAQIQAKTEHEKSLVRKAELRLSATIAKKTKLSAEGALGAEAAPTPGENPAPAPMPENVEPEVPVPSLEDRIKEYIDKFCEFGEGFRESTSAFEAALKEHGVRAAKRDLMATVKALGFPKRTGRFEGKPLQCFFGFKIKTAVQEDISGVQ